MTHFDVKAVGELIKSIAPTEEHRQKFGRTLLGSVLGQAAIAVGLLVFYLFLVIVLFTVQARYLQLALDNYGPFVFWPLITSPVILILLFQVLPTFWQARRERRLKRSAIGGDLWFKPGYFRLHPYSEADREIFKRLDGTGPTLVNWLRSATTSLLYLSGASGVGKSSLLAAYVLPTLRDAGWAIVETRLFGEPIECLRAALQKTKGILSRRAASELAPREFLKKAAEARMRAGAPPLLIVIDQFEEFLTAHGESEPGPFLDLVGDLANRPIEGLLLLLVFRSDYRPLVFKLNLPPLMAGQNWQEVMPYRRGEATSLLQSGGRELSADALDDLFRGLDRIEETPSLYRPITLNMIGLVLERMGPRLKGDPAQLIQSYLTACITSGESRDFAKPVLKHMISDSGTKERRTESNLADLTGLRVWQVRATLADLHWHGLVRRLEGAQPLWEIAHDFLARTIGQLIGRLRPTLIVRARPLIAPILILGWLLAGVLALPYWLSAPVRDLKDLGVIGSPGAGNSLIFMFPDDTQDAKLVKARSYLKRLSGQPLSLVFFGDAKITSLEPLSGLSNIAGLKFAGARNITSLEPLRSLTNLNFLDISEVPGITSLEPLRGLSKLSTLTLRDLTRITSLDSLSGLTNVTVLDLTGDVGITSLEPLRTLVNITHLNLSETSVTSLAPLKGLTKLVALRLDEIGGITSLEPLRDLTSLIHLSAVGTTNITSLEPLTGLANLRELNLSRATGITSLEPLRGLPKLTTLDLSRTQRITSVEPLKDLSSLTTLNLGSAEGIRTLEPLKGTSIAIQGASEELLATMK